MRVQSQERFLNGVVGFFGGTALPAQEAEKTGTQFVEQTNHLYGRVGGVRQVAVQHAGDTCVWGQNFVLASLLIVCRRGGFCKGNDRGGGIYGATSDRQWLFVA
jgi:hypothetical protein